MTTLKTAIHGIVALGGLVVAAAGAVTVIAPPHRLTAVADSTHPTSYAQVSGLVAIVILFAAAALVAVGATAWFGRPGGLLTLLGLWAAAAWLAPELAGSAGVTREIRSLALLLAPFAAPFAIHLPLRAMRVDVGHRTTQLLLAGFAAVIAVTAVGRVLTYDPFWVIDCASLPACQKGDNVLMFRVDIALSQRFAAVGSLATLLAGLVLSIWAGSRFVRSSTSAGRREWPVLLSAAAVGGCLAWWSAARLVILPELRTDVGLLAPMVGAGVAVSLMGCAVTWFVLGEMRRADALRHLSDLMGAESGPRTLEQVLAHNLRDPSLRVAYPLTGGAYVDEQGELVLTPRTPGGRSVVAIERRGLVVALVEHDASVSSGLDTALMAREIGAAARLAVDNERLDATVRAQLHELQASRSRIVAAGDAARERLERNLHDGAQQRLLAVSYELRLARSAAADAPADRLAALDAAVSELDRALVELRELAHGISPAVLSEAGLEAALLSLAEESPITLELGSVPEYRFPPATEAAAYFAVVEAVRRATTAAVERLDIGVSQEVGWLRLTVAATSLGGTSGWTRVEDRVGAAGGTTAITDGPDGTTLLRVELPCA